MKKTMLAALMLVLPIAGASAGETYRISVSARADGSPPGGKYVLTRTLDSGGVGSLEFREFAVLVRKALTEKGLAEATMPGEANLVVDVNFAIDEPKSVTSSSPDYGKIGEVVVPPPAGSPSYVPSTTKDVYGVTGYSSHTSTTYRKWLTIKAYDADALRASKTLVEKWTVSADFVDSSRSLRMVLPAMIYAARDYIAANSGRDAEVKVKWKKSQADVVAWLGPPPED